MNSPITCRVKPYIQPFERKLALRELEVLAHDTPRSMPSIEGESQSFRVKTGATVKVLARELAFWEAVCEERTLTTTQSLRESTVNVVRNGISLEALASQLPFKQEVPLPNRRCLRYGTHGLHEYRGKFFPQMVRSFINIANVPQGGLVADPFCGSGTTAVEAILAKRKVLARATQRLMPQPVIFLVRIIPPVHFEGLNPKSHFHACSVHLRESFAINWSSPFRIRLEKFWPSPKVWIRTDADFGDKKFS